MAVIVDGAEIVLTGTVGESWWGDGFTSGEVISALAQVGRANDVTIRLNSGGGYATEGAAIHAALKGHKGKVTVIVEGIAASAASLIAVAGDDVAMSLGSVMMIHDTATITWGTVRDHELSIAMLNSLSDSYADCYAEKTGSTADAMRALMKSETWLTPQEAVDQGFADRLGAANDAEPTAFAYGVYAKAPEKIVALATAKGWKPLGPQTAAPTASTRQIQETPMAESKTTTADPANDDTATRADERTKATARIKAIMTSDEAKGRESMAEHLAYETDTTAEAAVALLKVAPKADAGSTFAQRKKDAAADPDLGGPAGQPAAAKAGWDKAVARVNKRVA